nr:helix-turn-helix transcriptional regulator [Candidatus Sigynarchaeota archaeon]
MGKKLKARGQDIKLSPLEFMILLKVYEADPIGISGYDIIADLTQTFAGMWVAQSGTVYPLLSRMQEKNLIVPFDVRSELGPAKKAFKMTDLSREVIEAMIVDNFDPELRFFGNYLDFVCRMMDKLKRKNVASVINYEQVKVGLDLFSTRVKDIQQKLGEYMARDKNGNGRACTVCGEVIDREARFCPKCGKALA